MRDLSIASVTVAYNGDQVISRHLDALKRQTHKIDEIVVVNNASTDGTLKVLASNYPGITVLNQPQNGGVGVGFAAGLTYAALVKNHDWVWLFDQDSVPSSDGLALLLAGLQHLDAASENTAILAPVCAQSGTGMIYPGLIWRRGWRFIDLTTQMVPFVFVDSVISSGTLVKREAVERIGLPRADFFMDFVDHEYCLRLRRAGYRIAIIPASKLGHEIGSARRIDVLGLSKKWADHAPWREYYMARNEVFTIWQYYPDWRSKCSTLGRLLRHIFDILLFGREKIACFMMMVRGVRDGWAGNLGVRDFGTAEALPLTKATTAPHQRRTL
jgi:rhamnosyltransferase